MKNIEKNLFKGFLVMIAIFTILWMCSCSVEEKLTTPFSLDGEVTFCTPVFLMIKVGNDTVKFKNTHEWAMLAGDFLIVKDEFRTVHSLK